MYIHVTSIWQLCELENILYPLSIYFHIAKIRMENWPIWSLSYYWGFFLKRFFFSWQQRNIQVPKLQRTLRNKGSDSNNLWMCLNYKPSLSLNACRLIMLDYCVGQHTEILYELGKKADHTLWTIQGSPNWGHTAPVGGALGGASLPGKCLTGCCFQNRWWYYILSGWRRRGSPVGASRRPGEVWWSLLGAARTHTQHTHRWSITTSSAAATDHSR